MKAKSTPPKTTTAPFSEGTIVRLQQKMPTGNVSKLKIIYSNAPLRATPASGMPDERGDLREELVPFEVSIPGLSGEFFAFKVSGDSMYPSFEDGDLVLCESVADKNQINEEDAYVLQSRNGLYLKRVMKQYDAGNQLVGLSLSSDNQEVTDYAPFSVPVEELQNCLRVKMRLTTN